MVIFLYNLHIFDTYIQNVESKTVIFNNVVEWLCVHVVPNELWGKFMQQKITSLEGVSIPMMKSISLNRIQQ